MKTRFVCCLRTTKTRWKSWHNNRPWISRLCLIHYEPSDKQLAGYCKIDRGKGDQGALLPRSMRLDVPKFLGVDLESWIFAINEYFLLLNTPTDQCLRIMGFNLEGAATEWVTDILDSLLISFYMFGLKLHLQWGLLLSKPATLGDVFLLAQTIKARFDDQAAPVAGTSAGLEANKVVNNGDDLKSSGSVTPTSDSKPSGEVKVLNWVQEAIDVECTSDNNARDQASKLQTKVLVDGKQDEVKVVDVADEQNSDEPDVLEGNKVIGVGVNENNKGITMQRRLWHPGIKFLFRS
ncbi:hypothetical protein Tco_0660173 [Tanacetum coccineum]